MLIIENTDVQYSTSLYRLEVAGGPGRNLFENRRTGPKNKKFDKSAGFVRADLNLENDNFTLRNVQFAICGCAKNK